MQNENTFYFAVGGGVVATDEVETALATPAPSATPLGRKP